MRPLFLPAFFAAAVCFAVAAHAQNAPLLPVIVDGKWGYIDTSGNMVLQPRYDYAYDFRSNTLAVVSIANRFGLINCKGEELIPCREDSIRELADSVFAVQRNALWGLMDYKGKMLTAFIYDDLYPFSSKVIRFSQNDAYGLMDVHGNVILPANYDDFAIKDSLIMPVINGYYGLWDFSGKQYLDVMYDDVARMNRQVAFFEKNGKMGFVSLISGKVHPAIWEEAKIISPVYNYSYYEKDPGDFVVVQKNDKYGLYSADKDSAILQPVCDAIFSLFIDGYFGFTIGGKTGMVSENGKVVIPPEYDRIERMASSYLLVYLHRKVGLADTSGRIIVQPKYRTITYLQDDEAGRPLFAYGREGRIGLLRSDSAELTPPVYGSIESRNSRILVFASDRKYGVMDLNGNVIHPAAFDLISSATDRIHSIYKGTNAGLMNDRGTIIASPAYSKITTVDNTYKLYKGNSLTIIWINDKAEMYDSVFYENIPSVHVAVTSGTRVMDWTTDFLAVTNKMPVYRFYFMPDSAKWGVMEENSGRVVIEPQFDSYSIVDGDNRFAMVYVKTDTVYYEIDGCRFFSFSICGLVDLLNGRLLLKPEYLDISVFPTSNSDYWAARLITRNGEFGYATSREETCFDDFTFIDDMSKGVARVNKGGNLIVVNIPGKNTIGPLYDFIRGFSCKLRFADQETRGVCMSGKAWISCDGGQWGLLHYYGAKNNAMSNYDWVSNANYDLSIVRIKDKKSLLNNRSYVNINNLNYEKFLSRNSSVYYFEVSRPHKKYGFVLPDGRLLTDISYDGAGDFSEDLAAVRIRNSWGYIDKNGSMAIDPQYAQARKFKRGLAAVKIGARWGFAATDGKIAVKCDYNKVGDFSEDIAWVRRSGKSCFINPSGEILFDMSFKKCGDFNRGYAVAGITKGAGVLNTSGQWVIPPKYDKINYCDPDHGIVIAYRKGRYAVVSLNGEHHRGARFTGYKKLQDGMIAVRMNDKWGFVNTSGKLVVPCKYDAVRNFSDGCAPVCLYGEWGAVNKKGELVIPLNYVSLSEFSEGLAIAGINSKQSDLIDTTGKVVKDSLFVKAVSGFSEGRAIVSDRFHNKRFIDRTGKFCSDLLFAQAYPYSASMSRVSQQDGWGLLDEKNNWIICPQFDTIRAFSEGVSVVVIDGYKGVADAYGSIVLEPEYQAVQMAAPNVIRMRRNGAVGYANLQGKMIWEPTK